MPASPEAKPLNSTDALSAARHHSQGASIMYDQPDADDLMLLRALQEGQQSAFWTLWMKHSPRLFAVCLRAMRGNRMEAEDALAQAMLRAFDKLPRLAAGISTPASWLVRMTANVCMDIYRDRARSTKATARLERLWSDRVQLPEVDADAPAEELPAALIERLPDPLREVFVLRVLQQASYPEIATRLGLTCVTARKRVQLSRAALRKWRDEPAA
jgi:RNA polymerase sigma factor (sigma-70 family)